MVGCLVLKSAELPWVDLTVTTCDALRSSARSGERLKLVKAFLRLLFSSHHWRGAFAVTVSFVAFYYGKFVKSNLRNDRQVFVYAAVQRISSLTHLFGMLVKLLRILSAEPLKSEFRGVELPTLRYPFVLRLILT